MHGLLADTIAMRVPVLTYHSNNVVGNDYANNDHVALAEDLEPASTLPAFASCRFRASSTRGSARAMSLCREMPSRSAATTARGSTGTTSTIRPAAAQKSFANILRDFPAETGASAHMTSFVIVSPAARAVLDRTCLIGRGWWTDDWWRDAEARRPDRDREPQLGPQPRDAARNRAARRAARHVPQHRHARGRRCRNPPGQRLARCARARAARGTVRVSVRRNE